MLQRNSGAPPLLRVSESPAPGNESRITEQGHSLKTCSLVQGRVLQENGGECVFDEAKSEAFASASSDKVQNLMQN